MRTRTKPFIALFLAFGFLVGCEQSAELAGPVEQISPLLVSPYGEGAASTRDLHISAVPSVGNCNIVDDHVDTWTLQEDCTTTSSVLVPDGYTLDLNEYSITGTGAFQGAIVGNAGTVMHVINGNIAATASGCFGGDARLRGVLFDGASGSVSDLIVTDIHRGPNGCQEGNAIEIRNAPFDGTHPATKTVAVLNNVIADYQKGGVIANGDVDVSVTGNSITGLGRVDFIAQNGVQFGFGAAGSATDNSISDNWYTGCSNQDSAKTGCTPFVSAGILLFDVDSKAVKTAKNKFSDNQYNVLNVNSASLGT